MKKEYQIQPEQVVIGAEWLRKRCPKNDVVYSGPEVLRDFTKEVLDIVYPRAHLLEFQRHQNGYYLTCLMEHINKHEDIVFECIWKKYTQRIPVNIVAPKEYRGENLTSRFTYGVVFVKLVSRYVEEALSVEERLERLERIVFDRGD